MQFSESWLRSMVDPKMTSDELAHLLTMSGLEVEEVEPVAPPFSNVVVARSATKCAKHPNADRLNVCQVDAGTGTLLQHRLRRAERARRHEGRLRAWPAPCCRRVTTASRSRSRSAKLRGVEIAGHAVLGERTETVGRAAAA